MPTFTAFVVLLVLHNIDGDEVFINPEHIVMLQLTKEAQGKGSNELVSAGQKCVVGLDNGKFVSVVEDCRTIRQAIRQAASLM